MSRGSLLLLAIVGYDITCPSSPLHHPLLDPPYLLSPSVHKPRALCSPHLLRLLPTLKALLHVAFRVLVLHRHAVAERERTRGVPAHEGGARGHHVWRDDGAAAVDIVEEQPARVLVERELAAAQSIYRT